MPIFLQNESIRIDPWFRWNRIDSNRESECSTPCGRREMRAGSQLNWWNFQSWPNFRIGAVCNAAVKQQRVSGVMDSSLVKKTKFDYFLRGWPQLGACCWSMKNTKAVCERDRW